MINYLSFDIEDWFQVENFKSYIPRSSWDTRNLRVIRNTELILKILSDFNVKATFFVLGWIAKKCPELVKSIDKEGHEIASHGFWHELIYKQTKEEFRRDIQTAKKTLEDIIQKQITGYRAPSFSITNDSFWSVDILIECGYKYDSSIFPVSLHDRYGFKGINNKPQILKGNLIEVPISTFDFFGLKLPFSGGGYFRFLPYNCFKTMAKSLNKKGERFVFYLHPWELDVLQPRIKTRALSRFRHYINIKTNETKLKSLLKDFEFQPIGKILSEFNDR